MSKSKMELELELIGGVWQGRIIDSHHSLIIHHMFASHTYRAWYHRISESPNKICKRGTVQYWTLRGRGIAFGEVPNHVEYLHRALHS